MAARNAAFGEANRVIRRTVYVAHPLNAPTAGLREQNRERAQWWVGWLAKRYLVAPVADWILLAGEWPETPDCRAAGLAIDRVLVELCGTIVLVGPRVSDGMRFEASWAKTVVDLTGIFEMAPDGWCGLAMYCADNTALDGLAEIDSRMAAAGIERADG